MRFLSVLKSGTLLLTTAGPALLQDCQRLDPEHCCSTHVTPEAERGRALSATGQGHITLQTERCKQRQLLDRGALSYHSHCSFLCSDTVTGQWNNFWSAGYFKAQSSNSPPKNIFCVDIFKAEFLILSERLTCCDRRIRGFGGSSEPDSSPAQHLHPAQPCMSHLGQGLRHGKESQEGFLSITTPVLLWVTGSWGGHQLQKS